MAARKPVARTTKAKPAPKAAEVEPEPEVFDSQPTETLSSVAAAQNRMREVAKRGKKP